MQVIDVDGINSGGVTWTLRCVSRNDAPRLWTRRITLLSNNPRVPLFLPTNVGSVVFMIKNHSFFWDATHVLRYKVVYSTVYTELRV
jgi:hypothetical protein